MDVMTQNVCTVAPETPVAEIASILLRRQISAVPVVTAAGQLVGIVSEGDLMRRPEIGTTRRVPWWLELLSTRSEMAADFVKAHGRVAQDVMTVNVVTVPETASLAEIASILEKRRIKRVPVVREGKVVGIVSRGNLLQGLAAGARKSPSKTVVKDGELRESILARLKDQPWSNTFAINVVVTDGTVHLWGLVESEEERAAVRVVAEEVPGTRAVEDHLSIIRSLSYAV